MPFEYGNPGRPPGAKNKRTQLWETLEELLMGEGFYAVLLHKNVKNVK